MGTLYDLSKLEGCSNFYLYLTEPVNFVLYYKGDIQHFDGRLGPSYSIEAARKNGNKNGNIFSKKVHEFENIEHRLDWHRILKNFSKFFQLKPIKIERFLTHELPEFREFARHAINKTLVTTMEQGHLRYYEGNPIKFGLYKTHILLRFIPKPNATQILSAAKRVANRIEKRKDDKPRLKYRRHATRVSVDKGWSDLLIEAGLYHDTITISRAYKLPIFALEHIKELAVELNLLDRGIPYRRIPSLRR